MRHLDLGEQHLVQLDGAAGVGGGGRGGGRGRAARQELSGAAALGVGESGRDTSVRGPTPTRALSSPRATHLPTPPPLTSSSAVQGRESEVLRRSEWPLARDVDDRRRLRAPLQLLGMLKAQRLW